MSDKQFLPTDSGTIMVPLQPKNQFPEGWDSVEAIPMFGAEDKAAPVKKTLYPRWIRYKIGPNQDNTNYRHWLAKHFRNATQEDMTDDSFNVYWDKQDKAFLNGDQILMVGDKKAVLGHMKYNYQAANGRVNKALNNFQNERLRAQGKDLAINEVELAYSGPLAKFEEEK
jgi:hypothetical protein